jgi:hypothetical protein
MHELSDGMMRLFSATKAGRKRFILEIPVEKAGHGGRRETERSWREYLSAGWSPRANFGRWAVSLAGAAATAHVTPSERQKGLVARHVVCSAKRGSEDLVQIANPGWLNAIVPLTLAQSLRFHE